MNTARKLIMTNDELTFENETVIGLDEVVITPRIPWQDISLSYERINQLVREAVNEFNERNKYKALLTTTTSNKIAQKR